MKWSRLRKKRATSLGEIMAQVKPEPLEIPGFRPGATITVLVRPVVLMSYMAGPLGKPFRWMFEGDVSKKTPEQYQAEFDSLGPAGEEAWMAIVDAVVRDALVSPTKAEVESISPLSPVQKVAIFNKATAFNLVLEGAQGGDKR